jgi:hypothetical protein
MRRRKIPEMVAAIAAAVVLAVGGSALMLETHHDGGPGYAEHGMMQQFDGNMPGGWPEHAQREHQSHQH